MFLFDVECVYEDLGCLRKKTNMPEEKQVQIFSNFFLQSSSSYHNRIFD